MLRALCVFALFSAATLLPASACPGQPASDSVDAPITAKILAGGLTAHMVWGTDSPPFGHRNAVRDLAFSPDGQMIATYTSNRRNDNSVLLWEAATGKLLRRLTPATQPTGTPMSLAYSPDGKWIVASWGLGYSTVFDMSTGHEKFTKKLHGETIWNTRFLPDSSAFVTGGSDGRLCVTRVEDQAEIASWTIGRETRPVRGDTPFGGDGRAEIVTHLDVSRDGKRIVTTHWGSDTSKAILWQIGAEQPLVTIERPNQEHGRVFESTCLSPDGTQLIAAGARIVPRETTKLKNGPLNVQVLELRRWDAATGNLIEEISDPDVHGEGYLRISPDGKTLLTDDWGAIHFWRLGEKKPFAQIDRDGHGNAGRIAFSPNGTEIAAGTALALTIWNVQTGKIVGPSREVPRAVSAVAWSRSSATFAISRGNEIAIFELASRRIAKTLTVGQPLSNIGRPTTVSGLVFSENEAAIVAAQESTDPAVQSSLTTWSLDTAKVQSQIKSEFGFREDDAVFDLAPDGRRAVMQTVGLKLYDLSAQQELAALPDVRRARALRFMPDSSSIWVATYQGQAFRWDPKQNNQDGKYTTEWRPEKERGGPNELPWVESAVFSPDGQMLVTSHARTNRALAGGALVFWDNELGLARRVLRDQPPCRLAISPDGRLVAGFEIEAGNSKSTDTIHLWETVTGKEVLQLTPNDARATAISFSPDSKQLLIGYDRGTFDVWELK